MTSAYMAVMSSDSGLTCGTWSGIREMPEEHGYSLAFIERENMIRTDRVGK